MNYKQIYDNLISRAKTRKLDGYAESHHIIPRCMNGSDNKDNLVELTAREHYIAHMLLVKIYPGNYGLVKAVVMMCMGQTERNLNNRIYEWVRIRFSEAQSIAQAGNKNSQYGTQWIHNPNTKENKKIKKIDNLEEGWAYGKYKQPKIKKVNALKLKRIEESKELYSKYYELYSKYGFDEMKKLTGYNKSKPNLVQMFAKYVKDFVPQNGKQRG